MQESRSPSSERLVAFGGFYAAYSPFRNAPTSSGDAGTSTDS
jgi:hypothetical protein